MLKRLVRLLLALAILAAAGLVLGYYTIESWSRSGTLLTGEHIVELKSGTSLAALSAALAREGVVSNARYFHIWERLRGDYQRFQAGRYRFTGSVAPADVATTMIKGDVWNPVVLELTIPEGFKTKDVTDRLAANGVGQYAEITRLMSDKSFLQSLKVPSTTLEGYLFPATYAFHEMPSAEDALRLMVKTFWEHLPKDYENNVGALGLSLNQAVTFASLIELETRIDEERSLISEVIWRRLKDKTPLAIDASVIYGIVDYQGKIKTIHLTDAKNPYNTRIHVGLPPTPIGSPSVKSLEAVLTPAHFGNYYYVLMPSDIHHHFSKTLKEHNLNVKKFVDWTKEMRSQRAVEAAKSGHK